MILLPAWLTGCPTRPVQQQSTAAQRESTSAGQAVPATHAGQPYDIVSQESLLTLRVFRGGPLAKAGHNHVIASHALRGTLYVPADPALASFDVILPVTELTVDEAALRARESSDEFPPDVPDSAKEGTRRNMLGPALLDAEHYPEIRLEGEHLDAIPGGAAGDWVAHIRVTVRDRVSSIRVPVHYTASGAAIVVSGEFPLKQTDLGLTPFSALLGALQVVDEMSVRFRIVAHLSPVHATS